MSAPLRIGVSARLLYPDPARAVLPAKTVVYAEGAMMNWILSGGAAALLIPSLVETAPRRPERLPADAYAGALDGLVLQGGSDLSPQAYGEAPLRPEWAGDPERDRYEFELFRAFRAAGKPVLGVCRGCQLLNVAMGGSLYQDLATQAPGPVEHRNEARYDQNFHAVSLAPGSRLARLFGGAPSLRVNSIHHQGLRRLGEGLEVEARSDPDGVVEAVRWQGAGFIAGIQWHPEFMPPPAAGSAAGPILEDFLSACAARR